MIANHHPGDTRPVTPMSTDTSPGDRHRSFGGFTPDEVAALRKYVRLRLRGVPFLRYGPRGPFRATVSTYDAEGNFVSERPATEEEIERWREERRRLGLE
jgi:hypothetical protein